jgi:citrate/tricarballylate utilization protein
MVAAALALVCTVLFLFLKTAPPSGASPEAAGAFYAVVPEAATIGITGAAFLFAVLAVSMGLIHFWRDTKNGSTVGAKSFLAALCDILSLRNFGGGGDGCNVKDEAFSQTRRYFHHSLFYGFLLCFASTCAAAFYEHVLGRISPFPLTSVPVVLGTIGGVAMLIGIAGLVQIKMAADQAPVSELLVGIDYCFLVLLLASVATGLLLLGLRRTGAMSVMLALHLGVIVALFVMLPYCKFVHGLYRGAALVRSAAERLRHTRRVVKEKAGAGA